MEKNILIVDDALFMRTMLKNTILKDAVFDYVIEEAKDGEEAIKLFMNTVYDMVLLDITMPGIGGLDVLKLMKKHNATVPVIMCSAMAQESVVIQSMKAGAAGFIVKPFTAEKISEVLHKTFHKAG